MGSLLARNSESIPAGQARLDQMKHRSNGGECVMSNIYREAGLSGVRGVVRKSEVRAMISENKKFNQDTMIVPIP